jgi:hypothetical protein
MPPRKTRAFCTSARLWWRLILKGEERMSRCTNFVFLLLSFCATGALLAQETAPYPNGTSGLKCGTVPPPGQYWLMYNRLYEAPESIGPHGGPAVDANGDPLAFDLTAYANVHRFLFSTDKEIFGAKYAWNFVIPSVVIDVDVGNYGIRETEWNMADINVEPFVIEWHEKQYDFGFVYGFFAPTAHRNDYFPSYPGKAHWTNYAGIAGTYYLDEDRLWSASILSRYEVASPRQDIDIRAGDNFSFEWGIARNVNKVMDIGVSGYCSWQTTLDSGSAITYTNVKDRAFAIGPEIQCFFPKYKFGYHLRCWKEFGVVDRTQGAIFTFTLVKPF